VIIRQGEMPQLTEVIQSDERVVVRGGVIHSLWTGLPGIY